MDRRPGRTHSGRMNASLQTADEVAERLFGSLLGTVEIMSVYLGDRLGWYRSLTREGPASAVELARRKPISQRSVDSPWRKRGSRLRA